MKLTKIYVFGKIFVFEKFENYDGFWPTFIDYNSHETAKHDEKNRRSSQKASCWYEAIDHACSSSLQCGKEKKLSHMEAQKSKAHYKSPAKSTDISGSYRAV